MTTKLDQQLSDGELEQRLRAAFAVVVPLIEHGEHQAGRLPVQSRARRLPVAVACGAIVALGVAGGLAVTTRSGGGRDSQGGSQPSQVGGAAAGTEATGSVAPTSSGPGSTAAARSDRADQVQWFLPAALPDGYELTEIWAELRVDGTPNPDLGGGVEVVRWPDLTAGTQTWIRRGADGVTNEDTIAVQAIAAGAPAPTIPRSNPAPGATIASGTDEAVGTAPDTSTPEPDSYLIGEPNTTVHGLDAVIVGPPMRESPGWTVNWVESGMQVTLQTTGGVSEDEAMAIAESTTITADGATIDPAAVPTGFEPTEPDTSTPALPDRRESVTLVVGAESQHSIRVRIDTPAVSNLDEASTDETERRTIDGVDYSLFENDDTLYSQVVWFADGRQFEAAGNATIDDVLTVATGLSTATLDEATDAATTITAATQALPTVATTTLADGVEVSVHGPADDNIGVVGICVDAPEPHCVRPDGIMGQLGVPGMAITAVFHIDGDRRTIAWNGDQPELSDEPPVPDLVAAATGTGWFIDQVTPAGQPLRGISFRADDGSLTGVSPTDVIRP